MDRLAGNGYRNQISAALAIIPEPIRMLLHNDFLCGVDPLFAGLHRFEETIDGRSYRSAAHCAYPHHQTHMPKTQRRTTVVLPTLDAHYSHPRAIVHELGHVLDSRLGWEHTTSPVTKYAKSNRGEAFAEAFTSWLIPGYAEMPDAATLDYFDRLTWERGALRGEG